VTNAFGDYTIVGLGTATYWVSFFPPEEAEFLEQYFDRKPGIVHADDVAVSVGSLTPNINAALEETGQITVTDAVTHTPLAGNQSHRAEGYAIQWYRCGNGPPATPMTVASGFATPGIDVVLVNASSVRYRHRTSTSRTPRSCSKKAKTVFTERPLYSDLSTHRRDVSP
jgi:hypothetical protein